MKSIACFEKAPACLTILELRVQGSTCCFESGCAAFHSRSSREFEREAFCCTIWGLGFEVWGLGFGVWDLGFGIWGLGFEVWGLGIGN